MTQLMRLQQITCGHFKADDGSVQQIKNNPSAHVLRSTKRQGTSFIFKEFQILVLR